MLKRTLTATVCGLILAVAIPQAGTAQGNGKGKGHNKQAQSDDEDRDRDSNSDHGGRIVFSVRDRDTIRNYYQDRNSNLPPGLAKQRESASGIAKAPGTRWHTTSGTAEKSAAIS